MNASEVASVLPISRQAVVKHLRILESGGLVGARTNGRSVEFSVRPERTVQAARWLEQTASDWEQRIDALRRLAQERSDCRDAEPTGSRTVRP
jgi:DNA-binding transcriptional ArsR family regulator